MLITAKLLQEANHILRRPFYKGHAVKGFHPAVVHFILEIPLNDSLISFVEILFDVPLADGSACIPFLKPMLHFGSAMILRPPAFDVTDISRKYVLYAQVFLFQTGRSACRYLEHLAEEFQQAPRIATYQSTRFPSFNGKSPILQRG